jgi:hypothetical protein
MREIDMDDIIQYLASLDGARIYGGCGHGDAYQEPWVDAYGIAHINICHDDSRQLSHPRHLSGCRAAAGSGTPKTAASRSSRSSTPSHRSSA